ncbi:MAG: hypothetical protein KDA25_07070 [Phycisphaerales bacterium]|nr:hypothetical protein [Phycisphaerales bacterium]
MTTVAAARGALLLRAAFDRAGFLAVWIALYSAAAVVVAARLLDRPLDARAVATAFLLTMSVYLLDRVKPADRYDDPADAAAHPARHAFVRRHRHALRVAVVVLALAAAGVGWLVHPLAPLGVVVAHAGMLAYGTGARRPRPKDRLVLKNLIVGAGLAAMALGLVTAWPPIVANLGADVAVGGMLALIVFADAMLCDLDDAAADAAYGTRTVPNVADVATTWRAAMLVHAVAAAILVAAGLTGLIGRRVALVFAATTVLTTVGLRLARPGAVRDWADVRLTASVALAWAWIEWMPVDFGGD